MTKIKHFSTGKANLCIVELPETYKHRELYEVGRSDTTGLWTVLGVVLRDRFKGEVLDEYLKNNVLKIDIANEPLANWSIIAPVKDITEEQARRIMPKKYTDNALGIKHEALKELHTLLQSIPIYTENPFGEMPRESQFMGDEWGIGYAEYQSKLREWRRAEQHVFRNSILLVNNQ